MSDRYIGIDVGGTNIKIGCFGSDLNLISKTSILAKIDSGPEAVVENIGTSVEELLAQAGKSLSDVSGVGLGAPGPVDLENGVIKFAPNLPGFKDVPLKKMVGRCVEYHNTLRVAIPRCCD